MPLVFKSALARLRQAMDVILSSVNWHSPFLYADGIVLFWKSTTNRIGWLRRVLKMLSAVKVTLKLRKCSDYIVKVKYLDDIVRLKKLKLSEATTASVRELRHPVPHTELRLFWGCCNVLQCYVPSI